MLTATTATIVPPSGADQPELLLIVTADNSVAAVADVDGIRTIGSPPATTTMTLSATKRNRLTRLLCGLCSTSRRRRQMLMPPTARSSTSVGGAPVEAAGFTQIRSATACRCRADADDDPERRMTDRCRCESPVTPPPPTDGAGPSLSNGDRRWRDDDDVDAGDQSTPGVDEDPGAPSLVMSPRRSTATLIGSSGSGGPARRRRRQLDGRRCGCCGCWGRSAGSELTSTTVKSIPKYGVETSNEQQIEQHMRNINSWGLDIFQIAEASNNRPLTAIIFTILKERRLLTSLKIPLQTVHNFLVQLESHYHTDIPYHNNLHAADVAQSSHVLLGLDSLQKVFSDLELFAAIFACAVHDVDHPGFNSQFLVNSKSELAALYADEALLETHHLRVAFRLLQQDGCDVFQTFSRKQYDAVRRIVVDMVYATDMGKHEHYMTFLRSRASGGTPADHRRRSDRRRRPPPVTAANHSERIQILQCVIHCSDLSNPTKPPDLYRQWTHRITEEFFRQGDHEERLGLEISPICDRRTASVAKTQISFIDKFAYPLWRSWADFVYPECEEMIETMRTNRHWQVTVGLTTENSD